jgi:alcohol dehydrogenase, propanol-preferring
MMSSMIAARLAEGDEQLTLEEVPVPEVGPADALVEVMACGICGSDLHIIEGVTPTPFKPITLGHEPAGVVRQIGAEVTSVSPGDHVFVNPILVCGVCDYCRRGRSHICAERRVVGIHRDGALAEFLSVPALNLLKLPPDLSFEEAAIIESASTPFHALTARAPVSAGDAVAVIGVGGLGVHGVQIAKLLGASAIVAVDVADVPLERARMLGATHVVNSLDEDPVAAVKRLTGAGVDVALECVGTADTCRWALEMLRPGGVAALAGIGPEPVPAPPTTITARTEIELRGVYAYAPNEIERVARLIAAGQLDARAAISEIVPLEHVNEGLESFREKRNFPVRVVVVPSRAEHA